MNLKWLSPQYKGRIIKKFSLLQFLVDIRSPNNLLPKMRMKTGQTKPFNKNSISLQK